METLRSILLFIFVASVILSCQMTKQNGDKLVILWKDTEIEQLINEVSADSLKIRIKTLQDFGTRYTYEKQTAVADYIYNFFKEQNFDVRYQDYRWKEKSYQNVEVILPGSTNPNKYFVIGAHYDSISDSPNSLAPGADDNGSGVAVLFELVRILNNYDRSNTIRVVFFSNEEKGLYGSDSYVKYLKGQSGEFLGGLIIDTIGYCDENKDLDIATIPEYKWLAVAANQILHTYHISSVDLKIDKYCT